MTAAPKTRPGRPRRCTLARSWPLSLLVALLVSIGAPAPASADNAAVAVNTKDGTTLFDFAFQVRKAAGQVVDETNAAVAYSSCEACTTVAAAFQIVLVMGQAGEVTPTNLALAINDQCTACATYALAYQFVLGGSGPLRFTPDGRQSLNDVRRRLKELENSDLTPDRVLAELQGIRDDIVGLLSTQLRPAGKPDDDGAQEKNGATPPTREDDGEEEQAPSPTSPTPTTPEDSTTDDGSTTTPDDSETTPDDSETTPSQDPGSDPSGGDTTTAR